MQCSRGIAPAGPGSSVASQVDPTEEGMCSAATCHLRPAAEPLSAVGLLAMVLHTLFVLQCTPLPGLGKLALAVILAVCGIDCELLALATACLATA